MLQDDQTRTQSAGSRVAAVGRSSKISELFARYCVVLLALVLTAGARGQPGPAIMCDVLDFVRECSGSGQPDTAAIDCYQDDCVDGCGVWGWIQWTLFSEMGYLDVAEGPECNPSSYTVYPGQLPIGTYTLSVSYIFGTCATIYGPPPGCDPCDCDTPKELCGPEACCEYSETTVTWAGDFCLYCDGPDEIVFSKDSLGLAPGDSLIADVKVPPCSGQIKWEIVGDRHGVTIVTNPDDTATITATAGVRPGTIIVKAMDALDPINEAHCWVQTPLEIGCSACAAGTCAVGSAEIGFGTDQAASEHYECDGAEGATVTTGDTEQGGIRAAFNMGKLGDGESAGMLRILSAADASVPITQPQGLRYHLKHDDIQVDTKTDDFGTALYSVKTPRFLAVSQFGRTDDIHYEIEFYEKSQVTNWGTGGSSEAWAFSSAPFVKWLIVAPEGQETFDLRITREVGGNVEVVCEYTYTPGSGDDRDWKLEISDGVNPVFRTEIEKWEWDVTNSWWTRTYTIEQDGGAGATPWYKEIETFESFGWGWGMTSRVVDPSGANLTTTVGYYDDPNDPLGLVAWVQSDADGSWTAYDYDAVDGRLVLTVQPTWQDENRPSVPTINDAHSVELLNYAEALNLSGTDANDDGTQFPYRPRMIIERITDLSGTQIVSRSFHAYYVDDTSGDLVHVEKRGVVPLALYATASNLTTTTIYVGEDENKPATVDFPDGRRDVYLHDDDGMTYSFTPSGGPDYDLNGTVKLYWYSEVVHEGTSGPVTDKSTKETVIRDEVGLLLCRETFVYDGSGYQRVDWSGREYDTQGRLEEVYRSTGENESTTWATCCTQATRTDATGIVTEFDTDLLGRIMTRTKKGVTNATYGNQPDIDTDYDFSFDTGSGRRVETVTVDPLGAALATSRETDLAGRVLLETDTVGLDTAYSYTLVSNRLLVTRTLPTTATDTSEYHRSGQVRQVTGDAGVPRFYTYGVNSDGSRWTKVTTESAGSGRYTMTTSDMLGRVIETERPAFNHASPIVVKQIYDGNGRLASQETWHDTIRVVGDTFYEYDTLGSLTRTGLDADGSGGLTLASMDRISDSDTDYQFIDSEWWLVTVNTIYPLDNNASPKTLSIQRRQMTGLPAGTISIAETEDIQTNIVTRDTVVDRPNKLVTITTTYSYESGSAVSIALNGLAVSQTARTGETTTFKYDAIGRRTEVVDSRTGLSTVTTYDGVGRVSALTDRAGKTTTYGYYAAAQGFNSGRLKQVQNPAPDADDDTFYDYNARGQVLHVWGDVPQPVEVGYDGFAQRTSLKTYRGGSGWGDFDDWTQITPGTADQTQWAYDAETGLITAKTYADTKQTLYSFTPAGRLDVRTWSRTVGQQPIRTDYAYHAWTGELTQADYPDDGTPRVDFTYNRMGRAASVTQQNVATWTYTYSDTLTLEKEDIDGVAGLYDKLITRDYEPRPSGTEDFEDGRVPSPNRTQGVAFGVAKHTQTRVSVLSRDKCSRTVWFPLVPK